MAIATYKKIASVTVGSGGASSIDFTNIPSTYNDLILKWSVLSTNTARDTAFIKFNGSGANYSGREIRGYDGTNVNSTTSATAYFDMNRVGGGSTYTSIFTNSEFYIPNYSGNTNKSVSFDSTLESNQTTGTQQYDSLAAGLWSDTSIINRITFTLNSGSFAQHSSAVLYGIVRSN